jgi:hypothetical protein
MSLRNGTMDDERWTGEIGQRGRTLENWSVGSQLLLSRKCFSSVQWTIANTEEGGKQNKDEEKAWVVIVSIGLNCRFVFVW